MLDKTYLRDETFTARLKIYVAYTPFRLRPGGTRAAARFVSKGESMRRQESGFTLIELVIVLVILGILAAVAVPQFTDQAAAAKSAAASGNKSSVASGIATYTARNKTAPTGTQLSTEVSATRCSAGAIHIISQSSEGVKVNLVDANGGGLPTGCGSAVVGVGTAKYTTTL